MRPPSAKECDLAVEAMRTGFGLTVRAIDPIPTWHSTVFRIDTGAGRYAVRAHGSTRRPPDSIRTELAFLRHLRSHGLSVPEPLSSLAADDLHVGTGADGSPRYYDVTTWMGGVVRRDGLDPTDAHLIGTTLARIHQGARDFSAPRGVAAQPPPVHEETWLLAHAGPDDLRSIADWFSPADQAVLADVLARVRPALAALERHELEAGLLHKDFILGNCLWHEDGLTVLDFAEGRVGPFLYDLAPMLTNIGDQPPLRAAFLAGYRAVRPLSSRQEATLPVLEAVRHLSSCFSMIDAARQGRHGPALDVHLPYRMSGIRQLLPAL